MQPKPHPDPNGVVASAIVSVDSVLPPVRCPARYFGTLANGGLLCTNEKLTVGDISVYPNVGDHFTMTKEAFDLAYEECNPVIKARTTHRKRPPCK